MANLIDVSFKQEYRSGNADFLEDLYYPALKTASNYWRAVGFFSSSAFEEIGKPLADFVQNGGTMRLVTSVELQAADFDAIKQGLKKKELVERKILDLSLIHI